MFHLLTVFDILFMRRDLVSGTQSEQVTQAQCFNLLHAVCSNFFGVLLRHSVLLDTSYVLTTTQVMCTLVFPPPVQKFFSVPDHTPLYIAEAGDCGCTLVRIHCQDAVGQHESRLLEQHTPHWILDYVEKVRCVGQVCEVCG